MITLVLLHGYIYRKLGKHHHDHEHDVGNKHTFYILFSSMSMSNQINTKMFEQK